MHPWVRATRDPVPTGHANPGASISQQANRQGSAEACHPRGVRVLLLLLLRVCAGEWVCRYQGAC